MSPETICAFALECLELARNTKDPHHRALLLDIVCPCKDLASALHRFQLFAEECQDNVIENRHLVTPEPVGTLFKSGGIVFLG